MAYNFDKVNAKIAAEKAEQEAKTKAAQEQGQVAAAPTPAPALNPAPVPGAANYVDPNKTEQGEQKSDEGNDRIWRNPAADAAGTVHTANGDAEGNAGNGDAVGSGVAASAGTGNDSDAANKESAA